MPYVYSTTTNDTYYVEHEAKADPGIGISRVKRGVLVKGGTGLANKHLITPQGVVTRVSKEDAAFLTQNDAFLRHMKRGFVQIRDEEVHPEKVVAEGMEPKDRSTPIVPEDFKEDDVAKPAKQSLIERVAAKFR